MNNGDKQEIIEAIGELKGEIKVLNTRYDSLSRYMFKDLKEDIEKMCDKVDTCMTKTQKWNTEIEKYRHNSFRWMATALITSIIAIFSSIMFIGGVVI